MRAEQLSGAARLSSMDTPKQYYEFAEVCERLAIQTRNDQHKKILKAMALTWRQLAEKIEGKNDR